MAFTAGPFSAAIRPGPNGDDNAEAGHRMMLVDKMIDTLIRARPRTAAHALWILRRAYADYPLALRLAALAASMKDMTQ